MSRLSLMTVSTSEERIQQRALADPPIGKASKPCRPAKCVSTAAVETRLQSRGRWAFNAAQQRVIRKLHSASQLQGSSPQKFDHAPHRAKHEAENVDAALDSLIESTIATLTLLGRHSLEAFDASHRLMFNAYRFLKLRERDPERHEQLFLNAGIKPRKNTSLAKRCIRLALLRAGHVKAKSTEHDWACPSSDDLGHSAVFRSGGSGPSGVRG